MVVNNKLIEQSIEKIHQDCFETSFLYKRTFCELLPVADSIKNFDKDPRILCYISMDEPHSIPWLDITFLVKNVSNEMNIPPLNIDNATHEDFLWKSNCLELFIGAKSSSYYEINASLDGKFAVYKFDDYRNPSTLPPKTSSDITFQWRNSQRHTDLIYQFSLLISQSTRFKAEDIALINPCAILFLDNKPIYYAVNHANPPDFHNKAYWLDF